MQRRSFLNKLLGTTAITAISGALSAYAQTQQHKEHNKAEQKNSPVAPSIHTSPRIQWRCAKLTEGHFTIQVFAADTIVPALQVLDAVESNVVEMGHTSSAYYFHRNAAICFDSTLPFGLTSRQQNAWMLYGPGKKMMRDFFREHFGIVNFLGGNSNAQMGGWFHKEIKSLNDLKGLRYRIAGLGGLALSKLGVITRQIPAAEIYTAFEHHTIDAAEWIGPHDDERLGLHKVAPFYYYPGWWEGGSQFSFYIQAKQWDKLPAHYQAAIETASLYAHTHMMAQYDALNPIALARLLQKGVKLREFPKDVMQAAFQTCQDMYADEATKNPAFKEIYEEWKIFRNNEIAWFQIAEKQFELFNFAHHLKE